jgi:hypothetical protein
VLRRKGERGLALPFPLLEKQMNELRELSTGLLRSNDLSLDRYRLSLIAAITKLNDEELRELAKLISEEEKK